MRPRWQGYTGGPTRQRSMWQDSTTASGIFQGDSGEEAVGLPGTKTLKCRFYWITQPDPDEFIASLTHIDQLPFPDRLMPADLPDYVRLQDTSVDASFVFGRLIRVRMAVEPRKASTAGTLDDLNLPNDQGIAEESHFLCHPEMGVVLYCRGSYAPKVEWFENYVTGVGKTSKQVVLTPVIPAEDLNRIMRWPTYKSVFVKAQAADNPNFYFTTDPPERANRILRDADAGTVEVRIGRGRNHKSSELSPSFVRRIIAGWSEARQGDRRLVSHLEVTGVTEDGDRSRIDLCIPVLEEPIKVPIANRHVAAMAIRSALAGAFRHHEEELRIQRPPA